MQLLNRLNLLHVLNRTHLYHIIVGSECSKLTWHVCLHGNGFSPPNMIKLCTYMFASPGQ